MSTELVTEEARAWLTLLRAPVLGSSGLREAIACHGSAAAAVVNVARAAGTPAAVRDALTAPDNRAIERDIAWLADPAHHLVTCTDPDYPALLRTIPNPPAALFVVGDVAHLWSAQIAIVGARSATQAGLANARAFAKAFATVGNTVTSGLAEGVDGAAHAAALDAGGVTIAVLGTGPDVVYPRQHQQLARRIAAHGALVSEFPPGTTGRAEFFPRRNRIIAGLSLGTLVIEAGVSSGSLITARLAAEQGREVFALPGSIHNPLARGCHRLIRDGAKLVETADEVLEELRGMGILLADGLRQRIALPEPANTHDARGADPEYACLLGALDHEPVALDALIARTGLAPAALSSMLLMLELDGVVSVESGRYARR